MMKHKKLLTAAAAAVMLLSFGATTAFASDTWQGCWCTDANGDGICDHAAGSCQFVDANGDGVCDRCGLTCRGAGWLDADGDGVCDHLRIRQRETLQITTRQAGVACGVSGRSARPSTGMRIRSSGCA